MNESRAGLAVWFGILALAGCRDSHDPAQIGAPSFAVGGIGRRSVLVNPNADDNGTAKTIQEGIDMVAEGGTVMVLPGTYTEAIVIDKGLTLKRVGGESEPVTIVTPPGLTNATIQVATRGPVTIRDVSMQVSSQNGILAQGVFDLTLERLTMLRTAVTPSGFQRLVRPENNATVSGGRARLVVRNSVFDASELPRTLAISVAADLDGLIEGNVMRRTGISCIFLLGRSAGEINVDVVNNDLDKCARLETYAIEVGNIAMPTGPTGMTGVVNIIGNTIRNTGGSCTPTNAIRYELYTGRIERNSIVNVLQQCAPATVLALQAAIWVGSLRGFTPASPVVRFNDIAENAHAGLRVAPNITAQIDATCNWWGSVSGPSGAGLSGSGDAVVVESGGTPPLITPFATAPIAGTGATSC